MVAHDRRQVDPAQRPRRPRAGVLRAARLQLAGSAHGVRPAGPAVSGAGPGPSRPRPDELPRRRRRPAGRPLHPRRAGLADRRHRRRRARAAARSPASTCAAVGPAPARPTCSTRATSSTGSTPSSSAAAPPSGSPPPTGSWPRCAADGIGWPIGRARPGRADRARRDPLRPGPRRRVGPPSARGGRQGGIRAARRRRRRAGLRRRRHRRQGRRLQGRHRLGERRARRRAPRSPRSSPSTPSARPSTRPPGCRMPSGWASADELAHVGPPSAAELAASRARAEAPPGRTPAGRGWRRRSGSSRPTRP